MKLTTLVSRHGLTLAQYSALAAARRQALTRTTSGWRNRTCPPVQTPILRRLAERSLLAIEETTASITDAGRRLLAEMEGSR